MTLHCKKVSTIRHSALVIPTTEENSNAVSVAISSTVKPSSARPLPILPPGAVQRGLSLRSSKPGDHPIPLPSFANVPRSLPSTSLLATNMGQNEHSSEEIQKASNSDGDGVSEVESAYVNGSSVQTCLGLPEDRKKPLKHLWHAALILILERGRPITRKFYTSVSGSNV